MDNTQNNDEQATLPNFDAIRHLDDDGREYWFARELYPLLGLSLIHISEPTRPY